MSGSETMTSGHRYSFHSKTMLTRATVAIAGVEIGTTMRVSRFQWLAPAVSAGSGVDAGRGRDWWRGGEVPHPVGRPGRVMPHEGAPPPRSLMNTQVGITYPL